MRGWLICIGFGVIGLVWRLVLTAVPEENIFRMVNYFILIVQFNQTELSQNGQDGFRYQSVGRGSLSRRPSHEKID